MGFPRRWVILVSWFGLADWVGAVGRGWPIGVGCLSGLVRVSVVGWVILAGCIGLAGSVILEDCCAWRITTHVNAWDIDTDLPHSVYMRTNNIGIPGLCFCSLAGRGILLGRIILQCISIIGRLPIVLHQCLCGSSGCDTPADPGGPSY